MSDASTYQAKLTKSEISGERLRELAEAVARLEADGFKPTDVFPIGTIIQEGAGVQFDVTPDQLGSIVERLADLKELSSEIRIFPIGIIAPDRFRVETRVGSLSR